MKSVLMNGTSTGFDDVPTMAGIFEAELTERHKDESDEPRGKFKGDQDAGGKNKPAGKGTAGQDSGNRRNAEE